MKPTQETLDTRKALKEVADTFAKKLLAKAREDGVGLVHIHNVKGGITVAFKAANPYKNCFMVEVAVKTCSIEDTFVRKYGAVGALELFYSMQTIQLPLLNCFCQEDVAFAVKKAFTALYFSVTPQ